MSTVSLHGDDDEEVEPGQRYDEEEEPVSMLHSLATIMLPDSRDCSSDFAL